MLARLHAGGTFELLCEAAWARALGYRAGELRGMPLEQLMQVAGEGLGALLDGTDRPVDATLRCKDRTGKAFRLYRRFDAYGSVLFLLADELVSASEPTRPPRAHTMADERGRPVERLQAAPAGTDLG